jgi:hypothetical protein
VVHEVRPLPVFVMKQAWDNWMHGQARMQPYNGQPFSVTVILNALVGRENNVTSSIPKVSLRHEF